MSIQEIRAKAGSPAGYIGYFLLVFAWYFLQNLYAGLGDAVTGGALASAFDWGLRLLVAPVIMAGLFGGIDARQQDPDISSAGAFIEGIKKYFWRILVANLLYTVFYFVVVIILTIAGWVSVNTESGRRLVIVLVSGPISATVLFWYCGIVMEGKLFRGLARGLRTLLFNPQALLVGIVWAGFSAADDIFFGAPGAPVTSLALNAAGAFVLAGAKIVTVILALAIYKLARGEAPQTMPEQAAPVVGAATPAGDGWVKASFALTFLAFVPLVHFLALGFGILALRRKKQFVFRAAIACWVGAFFTFFYLLVIAGVIAGRTAPASAPGYAFLAEANPGATQQVALLQKGSLAELERQLAAGTPSGAARDWTLDCLSALAKYHDGDTAGAVTDFASAANKNPPSSEFYYYYGVALLDQNKTQPAATQFQAALAHGPRLESAARYLNLIQTAYTPSTLVSGLFSIFILLLLFTLHEYGHAFAAWKLGDDTAKNLGRLTLNPVAHLDIIGSILLPGILLAQNAGVIFGWAKPVPVNPANFKNPRRDHMRVSFAGPAVNLIIAMACFLALGMLMLIMRLAWPGMLTLNLVRPFSSVSISGSPVDAWLVYVIVFVKQLMYMSLALGIFNLLPVPPLDGSWILSALLPEPLRGLFEQTRRFGFLLFLLLAATPVLGTIIGYPLGIAWGGLAILGAVMKLG